MLFIRRCLTLDTFELVDTDDNSVEIVGRDLLYRASKEDVNILGVSPGYCTVSVRAVQDPREFGVHPINGVRICVYSDEITAIDVTNIGKTRTEIRLSRFAKRCGNFICRHIRSCSNLVIVLDDLIGLSDTSFAFGSQGVVIDLREVTRLDTVFKVYKHCYGEYKYWWRGRLNIIDNSERASLMQLEVESGWYEKFGFEKDCCSSMF